MRLVTSETALKYLEEDIVGVEQEVVQLEEEIAEQPDLHAEFDQVLQCAKYILEHLSEMPIDSVIRFERQHSSARFSTHISNLCTNRLESPRK